MNNTPLSDLPPDLPLPTDDGACANLESKPLPAIELHATNGQNVRLNSLGPILVLYIYPMTGRPDTPLPDGWGSITGARGCTPQSCSFRDHYSELRSFNALVFGLSTQTTEYQNEAKKRLHLPFELLSDSNLALKRTLSIPTFEVEGNELYKRVTLIAKANVIAKVFYPVFPPDQNAAEVVKWLKEYA